MRFLAEPSDVNYGGKVHGGVARTTASSPGTRSR